MIIGEADEFRGDLEGELRGPAVIDPGGARGPFLDEVGLEGIGAVDDLPQLDQAAKFDAGNFEH